MYAYICLRVLVQVVSHHYTITQVAGATRRITCTVKDIQGVFTLYFNLESYIS